MKQPKRKPPQKKHRSAPSAKAAIPVVPAGRLKASLAVMVALAGFLLYSNTFQHGYTADDPTVTHMNKLVKQGVSAMPTIFSTPYWYGYGDGKNTNNYRPMIVALLAVQWNISPDNPHFYHFTNVFLFALTGVVLFFALCRIFRGRNLVLPFAAALLYVTHPIHTEVVASIKSGDELLSFLFAVSSLYLLLRALQDEHRLFIIPAALCFVLSLLSKENSVPFVFILGLAAYLFTDIPLRKSLFPLLSFSVLLVVYLAWRNHVLGSLAGDSKIQGGTNLLLDGANVMNNALMSAPDQAHRYATAFNILGRYLLLLIYPHPLSWDYSYNQVPVEGWGNLGTLLSVVIYAGAGIYSVVLLKRKDPLAFAILFFMISISLVSNLLYLIGSTMAERFLYTPSLGFCLLLVWMGEKIFRPAGDKMNYSSMRNFFSTNFKFIAPVILLSLAYAFKTYDRNKAWKDDFTLYRQGVEDSPRSARTHYMLGVELAFNQAKKETVPEIRNNYLDQAIRSFQKALEIYPLYPDAQLKMEMASQMKDPSRQLEYFQARIRENPNDAAAYSELGVYFGSIRQFEKAAEALQRAVSLRPASEDYNNLGNAYAGYEKYREALEAYKMSLQLNPGNQSVYLNLGSTYGNLKSYDSSVYYFKRALEKDPSNDQLYYYIGLSLKNKGDTIAAAEYMNKAFELRRAKGK